MLVGPWMIRTVLKPTNTRNVRGPSDAEAGVTMEVTRSLCCYRD